MKWTILGSGGCQITPKPLCQCKVCTEARVKGVPYARSGPSAYLHDIGLLIDTPAEIATQLNRCDIDRVNYLMFTHLDPDHAEGFRIAEQIALDFRTWSAYPEKQICLLVPKAINERLDRLKSQFGSMIDFYLAKGFVRIEQFEDKVQIDDVQITAIPVDRGFQTVFIYVFEKVGHKVIYAPCDLKSFPEYRDEVRNADLLIIQPGIFEKGLKHGFIYPDDHISRTTLYTFEQTMEIAKSIGAKKTVFVHLEEYWNRSYDDYRVLEAKHPDISFAYDGMQLEEQ
ncbi:MBL fold metallo-hydrolase [Chloroflexota bacterium]